MKTILSLLVLVGVGLAAVGCDAKPNDEPASTTVSSKTTAPAPSKTAVPAPGAATK